VLGPCNAACRRQAACSCSRKLDMLISHSLQGTSPAASLKRERLVNRNAILRRTGFLEGSQGAAFLGESLSISLLHCSAWPSCRPATF
jgi:hypothetical protein